LRTLERKEIMRRAAGEIRKCMNATITKPSWKTRELRNKITGMRFQSFKEENQRSLKTVWKNIRKASNQSHLWTHRSSLRNQMRRRMMYHEEEQGKRSELAQTSVQTYATISNY